MDAKIEELVNEYRNDSRWELATEDEMREWARAELYGTDAERAEHRRIEAEPAHEL